jgi:hypothetical protein
MLELVQVPCFAPSRSGTRCLVVQTLLVCPTQRLFMTSGSKTWTLTAGYKPQLGRVVLSDRISSRTDALRFVSMFAAVFIASMTSAKACTDTSSPIETDRPDITNSSVVVPVGSFQDENGVNVSRLRSAQTFDGTNSRLRLGIAQCLEVLVDLPNYVVESFRGSRKSGFANIAPAVKWQMSPIPGKFDLSMTIGTALPTGATSIGGAGLQPYLQLPWSAGIAEGWAIAGMLTNFFYPSEQVNKYTNQTTLVFEREFGER